MYALNDNICIAYSNGLVVLVDIKMALPNKYLSKDSSVLLFKLMNGFANIEDIENNLEFKNIDKYLKEVDKINDEDQNVDLHKILDGLKKNTNYPYRLDYPISLTWVPTWKCNHSCIYCGVPKINPISKEEQIDSDLILEKIIMAVEKGVKTINIHGGDPLFYYDNDNLFKLIKLCNEKKVEVIISTKNYVDENLAKKLSEYGLKELQLSIDSLNNDVNEKLYSHENNLTKFIDTVNNLNKYNVLVNVNIVVTNINYNSIMDLLKFLSTLKLNNIVLSNYKCGPINLGKYSIEISEQKKLFSDIYNQHNFDTKNIKYSVGRDGKTECEESKGLCSGGRIALVILPNGECCYCDFLSMDRRFIFGDLNKQSIEEVWNSKELLDLTYPIDKMVKNNKCSSCLSKNDCSEKGICYINPLYHTNNESIFPDLLSEECFN